LLAVRCSFLSSVLPHFTGILVCWLAGSFDFFSVVLCVEKKENVPANA